MCVRELEQPQLYLEWTLQSCHHHLWCSLQRTRKMVSVSSKYFLRADVSIQEFQWYSNDSIFVRSQEIPPVEIMVHFCFCITLDSNVTTRDASDNAVYNKLTKSCSTRFDSFAHSHSVSEFREKNFLVENEHKNLVEHGFCHDTLKNNDNLTVEENRINHANIINTTLNTCCSKELQSNTLDIIILGFNPLGWSWPFGSQQRFHIDVESLGT